MLTIDRDAVKLIELRRELAALNDRINQAERIIEWARQSAHSVQEMIFDMEESKWK